MNFKKQKNEPPLLRGEKLNLVQRCTEGCVFVVQAISTGTHSGFVMTTLSSQDGKA